MSDYFSLSLSLVYQELIRTRSIKAPPVPNRTVESLYVNPHPNCSLINPDENMLKRMKKLGVPQIQKTTDDTEEHCYDEVATDSSLDWESDDDELYDDLLNVKDDDHIYDIPPDDI